MAVASITYLSDRKIGSIAELTYYKSSVVQTQYSKIQTNEILPFRVKFINTQIPGYDVNNPPPVGVAIIGVNNYIL